MGRASRSKAAEHRDAIVATTSRRIRERGIDGVTIPDTMNEVGLTAGGFYRHFPTKAALAATAVAHAFTEQTELLQRIGARTSRHGTAVKELAAGYLAPSHRENPGDGCPIAALAVDVSRLPSDSAVRAEFTEGFRRNLELLTTLADDGEGTAERRAESIEAIATLIGATILARSTAGDPLSDEILDAIRRRMGLHD